MAEPGSRLHKCTVKIQWERVEAWFIGVWRGKKKERRVVREQFVHALSILNARKWLHVMDKTERKFYSPSALCFIFKQQKHVAFDSYFVLAPTGLEIKATPCVTDEQ